MLRRLAVSLAVLALLHSAAWYGATLLLERQAERWVAAQGGQVRHGETSRTGWPFTAAVTYAEPRIATPILRWQAEALTLRWLPWDATGFWLEAGGAQRLASPTVNADYTARRAALRLPFAPDGESRIAIAELAAPGISLGALDATQTGYKLVARLQALAMPGQPWPPLAAATLDAAMTPLPPGVDPLRRWIGWRDAGGRVELTDLTLRTDNASAKLTGSATLDAALRPAGDGVLVLHNAPAVIDAAVAAGALPRGMATAARLATGLLARPAPDGGPPMVSLPVQGRDGRLSVGGLAVAAIPPLAAR